MSGAKKCSELLLETKRHELGAPMRNVAARVDEARLDEGSQSGLHQMNQSVALVPVNFLWKKRQLSSRLNFSSAPIEERSWNATHFSSEAKALQCVVEHILNLCCVWRRWSQQRNLLTQLWLQSDSKSQIDA